MALSTGTRLGRYEILSPIGKGGMGEVYKANDTRLDRTVAIKVLPEHLAESPERKARFEREAKAISQLNHPHICILHDFGEQDGTDYLVMEYIEGETLAERLSRGPLPLDEALEYGIQIADGLDTAHRAGIVHRDLKPGNAMLTKSGVKLLDFGLAKVLEMEAEPGTSDAPTQQRDLTKEQAVIGTLQYMAPEQLEGKTADARTDLFAFGALLYEMLTGKKAFSGESQASLIGAILKDDPPPLAELHPMSPPLLERIVHRCLAKDPHDRWQTARDLMLELKWIAGGDAQMGVAPPAVTRRPSRERLAWVLAVLLSSAVTGITLWNLTRPPARPVARFVITPPPTAPLTVTNDPNVAISPDGSHIVYLGRGEIRQLYVRPIDQMEATPIPGTELSHSPFFSPDGRWVGFFADRDRTLKKVSLTGGSAITLCEAQGRHLGASWGPDDSIVFSSLDAGLARVPASGGKPEAITKPDALNGERHEFPAILPGGEGILFTERKGTRAEDTRIALLRLDTGETEILVEGGTQARYAPTGHLVYSQGKSLWAAPFDLARLETTGPPVPVLEDVATTIDGPANFAFSSDGSLVYVPSGLLDDRTRVRMAWVDRQGESTPLVDSDITIERQRKRTVRRGHRLQWLLRTTARIEESFICPPDRSVRSSALRGWLNIDRVRSIWFWHSTRAHDGFYLALPIKAETRLSEMPRLTRVLVSFVFLDTTGVCSEV